LCADPVRDSQRGREMAHYQGSGHHWIARKWKGRLGINSNALASSIQVSLGLCL
jgi:hypothetical protein